jgi:hypothetical protein
LNKSKKEPLSVTHPHLIEEWDFKKNDELEINPDELTYGSKKTVWWTCKEKKHSYDMKPNSRTSNKSQSCPYCSNQRVCIDNCLMTLNPQLASEWDYEINSDTPYDVIGKAGKVRHWICSENAKHRWKAKINDRWHYGCPCCSGHQPSDEKSLDFSYPHLMAEWSKLNNFSHSDQNYGSNRVVIWECKQCFNKWEQSIKNRTLGNSGCPKCNNMGKTSFPEYAVKFYLSKQIDCLNRNRLNGDEIDIWLPSHHIAIEYDGVYYHKDKQEKDTIKTRRLQNSSLAVIRIREVGLEPIEGCINIMFDWKDSNGYQKLIQEVIEQINGLKESSYLIPDVNIQRDNIEIYGDLKSNVVENSFSIDYPQNFELWDYEKNKEVNPHSLRKRSRVEVYWLCEKGHSWKQSVSSKNNTSGCPYCNKTRVSDSYNLQLDNPTLCEEWNYTKNEKDPEKYLPYSHNKVWWICINGHEWNASINNRNKKHRPAGCKECWSQKK